MKRPSPRAAPPTAQCCRAACALLVLLALASHLPSVGSFTLEPSLAVRPKIPITAASKPRCTHRQSALTKLRSKEESGDVESALGEAETVILGVAGTAASSIMLYSESVLFRTGCGLPAGPLGLVGAAEGISYLGVVALVGYSVFTKVRTGKGLPAGPGGILGAAEGLAYLAVVAGSFVLIAQITNFGYMPNAVPMEGGMCQ
ncbi:hypothetical protein ACHAXT_011160 [Thalassiosira profunda]